MKAQKNAPFVYAASQKTLPNLSSYITTLKETDEAVHRSSVIAFFLFLFLQWLDVFFHFISSMDVETSPRRVHGIGASGTVVSAELFWLPGSIPFTHCPLGWIVNVSSADQKQKRTEKQKSFEFRRTRIPCLEDTSWDVAHNEYGGSIFSFPL